MPARLLAPIIALAVLVAFWISVQAPDVAAGHGPWLTAEVSGAPSCIDAASLLPRAEALLGPDVTPPPTRVELDVAPEPDAAWAVQLRIEAAGEIARRSLRGHDCATLSEAVALVVAVHVDPLSVATRVASRSEASAGEAVIVAPPDPPESITEPAPTATPTPRGPLEHAPQRPSRPRPRPTLGAAAMAELGVLPRAAGAFELDVGLRWPHASAELAGLVSVGPRASAPEAPDVRGTFRLYAAAVRGCGVLGRARMEAALCGALELGDLWAQGDGVDEPATVHALWVAAALGVRPRFVVHPRVALGGIVDLLVPLRRHRFAVPDAGVVHTVAPIAARFGLSVEVRLR